MDEPSLKQLLPLFDQLAKAQTFYNIRKPARTAKKADADRSPPLADVTPCEGQPARDGEGQNTCLPARSFYSAMPRRYEAQGANNAPDVPLTNFSQPTVEKSTVEPSAYPSPPAPAPMTQSRLGKPTSALPMQQAREDPELLTARKALTLQGAQQVLAILRGRKLIENRAWRLVCHPLRLPAHQRGPCRADPDCVAGGPARGLSATWCNSGLVLRAQPHHAPGLRARLRLGPGPDLPRDLQGGGVAAARTLPRWQRPLGSRGMANPADPATVHRDQHSGARPL